MRLIIIIYLLFGVADCFSQRVFKSDNRNSAKLSYGLFYPIKKSFGNPIENLNNTLTNPISFISIAHEHPRGYGVRNVCHEFGLNYFLNQVNENSDGIKTNWFAISLYGFYKYDIFPQNKYVDLFVGGGWIFGEQFLTVKKNGNEVYRNFNSSLLPHIEFRAQPIKRISIGISSNFSLDITKSKWRTFSDKTYAINPTRFT